MKSTMPDKYYKTAIILLSASAIFIALPLFIRIGDATAAASILAGMVFIMAGSFIFILSGTEPVDARIVATLPVQGCATLCRIFSERGIQGSAHLLPPRCTDVPRVMQFNPCTEYDGTVLTAEHIFVKTEPRGFLTVPSSNPLITVLREKNALVIPRVPEELTVLLREVLVDTLDFASRVSVVWDEDRIIVTLFDYQLIGGCRILTKSMPECCNRYPCPVCSLCGTLIAEGLDEIIVVEECTLKPSAGDITIILRKFPAELKRGDTDSGNSH